MKNRNGVPITDSLLTQARRRSLLSSSVLIIVASVLSLLVIVYPQVNHTLDSRKAVQKKQEQINLLRQKVTQLNRDLNQVDYLTNNETVQLALPDTKPLLEVLTSLDQVKRATEIELFDLEARPGLLATGSGRQSRDGEKAEDMTLEFTIEGTFAKVSDFMELLEKVAPFTTISAFEISNSRTSAAQRLAAGLPEVVDDEELIQVTVESKTFFYNPTVKYSITAPLPKLSQENSVVIAKLAEFMAVPLPEQREITGGGTIDLFGVETIEGL